MYFTETGRIFRDSFISWFGW